MSQYHNDPLARHFKINKIIKLIGRKYYWPRLKKNVKTYVQDCNIYIILKVVKHKSYSDLLAPTISTYK